MQPPRTDTESTATTILVCEDEASLRELIRISLGDAYDVLDAEDGPAALELIRGNRPDAIVLDVMLPGMSGLEVLRTLREEGENAPPVVALSAWTHLEEEALAAGAECFLSKPFDPEKLRECVEAVLRR